MPDTPGSKAELDREGIDFTLSDKVTLDKEGMNIDHAPGHEVYPSTDDENSSASGERHRVLSSRMIIFTISGFMAVFFIISGLLLWNRSTPEPAPAQQPPPPPIMAPTYTPASELILEPFIVLYDPLQDRHRGMLVAQVSLQVSPHQTAFVESHLFEIRQLIQQRLVTNAQIYSNRELEDLLTRDLRAFNVNTATFIQYELR